MMGNTSAVNVICCPSVVGFAEDVSARVVAPAVADKDAALIGMANGLFVPLLSTKSDPETVKSGKLSTIGANVTFAMQLAPADRVAGQLLVSEKFNVVCSAVIEAAALPELRIVTD